MSTTVVNPFSLNMSNHPCKIAHTQRFEATIPEYKDGCIQLNEFFGGSNPDEVIKNVKEATRMLNPVLVTTQTFSASIGHNNYFIVGNVMHRIRFNNFMRVWCEIAVRITKTLNDVDRNKFWKLLTDCVHLDLSKDQPVLHFRKYID
jgi:hypothetical protein